MKALVSRRSVSESGVADKCNFRGWVQLLLLKYEVLTEAFNTGGWMALDILLTSTLELPLCLPAAPLWLLSTSTVIVCWLVGFLVFNLSRSLWLGKPIAVALPLKFYHAHPSCGSSRIRIYCQSNNQLAACWTLSFTIKKLHREWLWGLVVVKTFAPRKY